MVGKKSLGRYMNLVWSLSDALPDADMDGNVLAMIEHLLVQRRVKLDLAYNNNNAIKTTGFLNTPHEGTKLEFARGEQQRGRRTGSEGSSSLIAWDRKHN